MSHSHSPHSSSLVSLLLSRSSTAPPHLRSLPTRRSSDLRFDHHALHAAEEAALLQQDVIGELVALDAEDRKSTRLNSSHRCISYAVFCLKKKTCLGLPWVWVLALRLLRLCHGRSACQLWS